MVWVGIEYNKKKLSKFVKKYKFYKSQPQNNELKEVLRIMDEIIKSHGSEKLEKLLNNDLDYARWSTIEKLSQKASIEIILDGKYSKKTFYKISNLPVIDFKLIMKRTQELIKIINSTITDTDIDYSKIAGVK
jgi:hypothetical protein